MTLVFMGWVLLIDAVRTFRGRRSYLPLVLKVVAALSWVTICAAILYAGYTFIPLKGFVVLGSLAILAALCYIAREMHMIRRSNGRQ